MTTKDANKLLIKQGELNKARERKKYIQTLLDKTNNPDELFEIELELAESSELIYEITSEIESITKPNKPVQNTSKTSSNVDFSFNEYAINEWKNRLADEEQDDFDKKTRDIDKISFLSVKLAKKNAYLSDAQRRYYKEYMKVKTLVSEMRLSDKDMWGQIYKRVKPDSPVCGSNAKKEIEVCEQQFTRLSRLNYIVQHLLIKYKNNEDYTEELCKILALSLTPLQLIYILLYYTDNISSTNIGILFDAEPNNVLKSISAGMSRFTKLIDDNITISEVYRYSNINNININLEVIVLKFLYVFDTEVYGNPEVYEIEKVRKQAYYFKGFGVGQIPKVISIQDGKYTSRMICNRSHLYTPVVDTTIISYILKDIPDNKYKYDMLKKYLIGTAHRFTEFYYNLVEMEFSSSDKMVIGRN